MSKESIIRGFNEVFALQKNLKNPELKRKFISDKSKIEQFINGCQEVVGERKLITCYLHGSATRQYGKHNDLDLLILCADKESTSKLKAKIDVNTANERPYIDANFITLDGFIEACKKPFADGNVSGQTRAMEEFRLRIILSVIHGVPIYNVEKGDEIMKQSRKSLEEYYGIKKFKDAIEWWQKDILSRNATKT